MIAQLIIYLMVYWPFRIIFDFKTNVAEVEQLSSGGRYLIAANHRTWLDVFLILSSLPLGVFLTLIPIKIFTANVYMRTWWQRLVLFAIGGFPANFSHGLKFSDQGFSLFIFPEGKRVSPEQEGELKSGLGRLVKSRDFTVLPVFINYGNGRKVGIKWRRVIYPKRNLVNRSEKVITSQIFNKVMYG